MTASSTLVAALVAAGLVFSASAARLPFRTSRFEEDNSLSPVAKLSGPSTFTERDWVNIKDSGPRMNRVSPGGYVELVCEATGSPTPNVQWFHNSIPVTQGIEDNNSIGEHRIGSVISRLVLECVTPRHQGTYNCVANSGSETIMSQPSMLFVQGKNASGLLPMCAQTVTAPPRIVTWSPFVMETIGNVVLMPCISMGNPQPQVYWIDEQKNLLIKRAEHQSDDRYKVLDSGDLMISAVRWADMGMYRCVAESPLGMDTSETFLYPMARDR